MKKLNITTLLCGLILFIAACGPSSIKTEEGSTTATSVDEAEGAIGKQIWTSKNLNVTTYRNGEVIPEVKDAKAWANLTTGAWCYYENKTVKGTTYGKLYNWYAVNDARGLAPKGYHIPTDAEWTILTESLGDEAGTKMKSTSGWENNGNGNNTSGFAGLPGDCCYVNGNFDAIGGFTHYLGVSGCWWSSSEGSANGAWYRA